MTDPHPINSSRLSTADGTLRFLFDHIPKSAGTSIHSSLSGMFGPGRITPIILYESHNDSLRAYGHFAVIAGHVNFEPGESLDPARHYLTLLREPIDRVLSLYYFFRHCAAPIPEGTANPIRQFNRRCRELARSLEVKEFMMSHEPAVCFHLDNFMTAHYSRLRCLPGKTFSAHEKLQAASDVLRRYAIVGTYDRIPNFLKAVGNMAGLPAVETVPRLNQTDLRPAMSETATDVLRIIAERNSMDQELYASWSNCAADAAG